MDKHIDPHIENILQVELIRVDDGAYINVLPFFHETTVGFLWQINYKNGGKKYAKDEYIDYPGCLQAAIDFYNENK